MIAKVRTQYNFNDVTSVEDRRTKPIGESCTTPDMSCSIKEILKKFVSGVDPGVIRHGTFEKNPDIDAPTNLVNFDPTDAMTKYEKDCL